MANFHECGIPGLAEEILVSQEGFYYIELGSQLSYDRLDRVKVYVKMNIQQEYFVTNLLNLLYTDV